MLASKRNVQFGFPAICRLWNTSRQTYMKKSVWKRYYIYSDSEDFKSEISVENSKLTITITSFSSRVRESKKKHNNKNKHLKGNRIKSKWWKLTSKKSNQNVITKWRRVLIGLTLWRWHVSPAPTQDTGNTRQPPP